MKDLTLRAKITLWYTLVLLLVLSIFSVSIYLAMSRALNRGAENLTKAHASQAASSIEFDNERVELHELKEFIISGTYIEVYDAKNHPIAGDEMQQQIAELPPIFNKYRRFEVRGNTWLLYDKPVYQQNKVAVWVRASRPLKSVEETLHNLAIIILIAVPICILIAAGGGLFLASRALSPIDHITKTARAIGQGDLTQRLNLPPTEDEVGRLAMVFDEMLDKLEGFFKRERQFTSDASHELRTPVAVINAEAEEALAGDKSNRDLKGAMKVVLKESQKMGLLVSQLLKLTRSDENKSRIEIETIDLTVIAEEVIEEMRSIAQQKKIELHLNGSNRIEIEADQALMTSLFINLIDNAIHYNKEAGFVKVNLSAEKELVKIVVEDNGIGIAKKHLPHIFDRFYRVDKARSGDKTGLGLSIIKWIVEVHKGSIRVESEPGSGTRFEVFLPVEGPYKTEQA